MDRRLRRGSRCGGERNDEDDEHGGRRFIMGTSTASWRCDSVSPEPDESGVSSGESGAYAARAASSSKSCHCGAGRRTESIGSMGMIQPAGPGGESVSK